MNGQPSPPRRRGISRPGVRLALAVAAGYLCGWALGRTPAPEDPAVFWIGNLAGPYLVIALLAGAWALRSPLPAALSGAGAAMAAVAGFYDFFRVGDVTNMQMDLPASVTARSVLLRAYGQWFANLLWGPGGVPWLTVGLAAGVGLGYLGYRWAAGLGRWGPFALGAALFIEPLVYATGLNVLVTGARYGVTASNLLIWGVELLLGALVVLVAWRARRPSATTTSTATATDRSATRS